MPPSILRAAMLASHCLLASAAAGWQPGGERPAPAAPIRFIDATDDLGLGGVKQENQSGAAGIEATRLCFADLNADGRPDVVVRTEKKYRVFLHTLDPARLRGFWFAEVAGATNLPAPAGGDCLVFADIDNDSVADAVLTRSLDVKNEKYAPPEDHPKETAWLKGNADGTFGLMSLIGAKKATTACIAVGDVDRDGRLDLYLGNWYTEYGKNTEAFTNDLYVQSGGRAGAGSFRRVTLPEDAAAFSEEKDEAGRPTYGAMIVDLVGSTGEIGKGAPGMPQLLELSYGRRANRLWRQVAAAGGGPPAWVDDAERCGLAGDSIRHGKYPEWLKEVAKQDPRHQRSDELPYRSHGNTFDAAIGDVDNDGRVDVCLAEITHAWAGDSSDRTRLLFQVDHKGDWPLFNNRATASLDRIPPPPDPVPADYRPRWNQGDLFCELADLDHDGRLDVILSSGDYPDPPPRDNRLRIFHQQPDGSFKDVTPDCGIDHVGSGQISLADVDVDGDMDLLVAQSYNRFSKELAAQTNERQRSAGPRLRLFLNQASDARPRSSITIAFVGNPKERIAYDPLGLVARLTLTRPDGSKLVQSRQLIGIGGHAGKQHQFLVHFGLAGAEGADAIEVVWPTVEPLVTVINDAAQLRAGHYVMRATRQ